MQTKTIGLDLMQEWGTSLEEVIGQAQRGQVISAVEWADGRIEYVEGNVCTVIDDVADLAYWTQLDVAYVVRPVGKDELRNLIASLDD